MLLVTAFHVKNKTSSVLSLTLGLHNIGKWDDIDIDVQYCDINITHNILTFYPWIKCTLCAKLLNIFSFIIAFNKSHKQKL